ncbi:MAG: peptidylprolyl isomerase [Gammaproteobacteria bacterium]|nr:peptidylprolyl isomerase [Gammaproteobacteria bacterium]MBT3860014.1 peptidylprolyl isomerase [Gammaproteobacteria bacterium]MBT3987036.1 peptidylprolyl isomerase [Gammaproteobacteria bacterium]MBT4256969.1 peptidylprolyl isomerase [Gammaproteobacteria bacterium]MBT4580699.1 peptidylprolyl isomerase [Gammaproteobacteria bacterium]
MDSCLIESSCRVSLHFSLSLTNGETIDSNFEGKPASFRLGDGSMLPGFEQKLLGLCAGSELEVLIPAEQAFGEINLGNQQCFAIAKFRNLLEDELMPAEIGSVVSFKDAGGFDLPGVVFKITDESVYVDFNHPLAGREILFKAKIVSVMPADVNAVEIKL